MSRCAQILAVGGGCLLLVAGALGQLDEPLVRQIEVRFDGPETINRAVVLANVQTSVGQPRSRDMIERDVRNLVATGYFSDVRVLEEPVSDGVKIIFQVRGKATIRDLKFEGVTAFKEERLKRELELQVGDILDERKAHQSARKLTEFYQKTGYPDVQVSYTPIVDRDTGRAVLKFSISEGPRVFIKQIRFDGAKAFSQRRLQKLMKTRYRWWGSWLAGTGVLKDEEFKEDLEKIRDFYQSQGYMDAEVRTTRVERVSTRRMVIHVELFEGRQYRTGTIKIEGNKLFPTTDLERVLRMKTGTVFTPDGLNRDMRALENYYGARGYLDTIVRSSRLANIETGQIDLVYTIREGELTYIERIPIRGNTKTKSKVIRRELAVAPGDIYNTVKVDASVERLKNLGYFSKVEAMPEPTTVPGRKDLVLSVEEQRTGSVTFGAGFSSIDNLVGFVELTQGNFDLFNWPTFTGGGQKMRLRLQLGTERKDYIVSFTEPWFLDQRLALGVDFFRRENTYQSDYYAEDRLGGAVRLEKALTGFIRAQLEYSLQDIELSVEPLASEELRSQDGEYLRSALSLTFVYDSRNSVFLTTRGNRTEFSAELVGGPLGGDVSVYKLNAKSTFYFPFFNGHVLQLLAAIGVVDAFGDTAGSGPTVTEIVNGVPVQRKVNDVPIFDRYFLGGANTLRGFKYRAVGPRDVLGEPVGGNTYCHATAEYTIPIVERVRGAIFFDIGNVWADSYELSGDFKANVGLGIRLNLPVGPLRLDYGYPVITDTASGKTGRFQFSVGYQF